MVFSLFEFDSIMISVITLVEIYIKKLNFNFKQKFQNERSCVIKKFHLISKKYIFG